MAGFSFRYKVRNPYFVACIACMGGLLYGFDVSSVSGFIGTTAYKNYFGNPQAIKQAGITSSMAAGSSAGSLVSGWTSDRWGRQACIQLSAVVWIIGAAIQCSSMNVAQLVAGRVIAGFAIGLSSTQVPVYIAELAPKDIRGRLVGLFQWAITFGIMIMFYIAFGLTVHVKSDASWRAGWGIQMVPGVLMLFGTFFLDESPRWLAAQDRWDEAIEAVAQIHAKGDHDADSVRIEIETIKEAVRIEHQSRASLVELFSGKSNLRRTFVGLSTQIWQQLTGMNVLMYYVVDVFQMAGYDGNANLVASSIQYVINVVMTVPPLLFIDRWGRRRVFIAGAVLMFSWLFIIGAIFATKAEQLGPGGLNGNDAIRMLIPKKNKAAGKAILACSYLFVATFASTWGPTGWVYVSEVFPLEQRAVAVGLCGCTNWAVNFAIGMFTLPAFKNITWKTYMVFATFGVAMTIHVVLMFPETKDKRLEEIDMMWQEHVPAWKTAAWVPPTADIAAIRAMDGGRAPSPKTKVEHASNISDSNTSLSSISVKA